MSEALLSVRDLRVEFATRRGPLVALDGVSFDIAPGEVLGMVGESGAGKSLTGLSIIGLLDPPGRMVGGEIALNGAGVAEGAPADIEGDAPVEADDVGPSLTHGGKQRGSIDTEVDDGDAERLDVADERGGGREGVLAVVGGGERADPGVEDLDDVGAGFDLLGGVFGEDGDELVHEDGPGVREW